MTQAHVERVAAAVLAVLLAAPAAAAQERRPCTPPSADLVAEGRDAALLIRDAVQRATGPFGPEVPAWDELGDTQYVRALKASPSPLAALARRIQWGARVPLPGWRIHYVAAGRQYSFSLRAVEDRCGLTFMTNDEQGLVRGMLVPEGTGRVVPLGTF